VLLAEAEERGPGEREGEREGDFLSIKDEERIATLEGVEGEEGVEREEGRTEGKREEEEEERGRVEAMG